MSQRELVLTRVFNAPRELVFKVWIDPAHVARWWGPRGFTSPVCELDVRPGGAMKITMQDAKGVEYPGKGVFHEIVPPERLVFTTTGFEDKAGNPQLEVLNTVTFEEQDGKTRMTLHLLVTKSTPAVERALEGQEEGWNQSLDRLADELARI